MFSKDVFKHFVLTRGPCFAYLYASSPPHPPAGLEWLLSFFFHTPETSHLSFILQYKYLPVPQEVEMIVLSIQIAPEASG